MRRARVGAGGSRSDVCVDDTRRYPSYGGGLMAGRIVRFTPNGLSVITADPVDPPGEVRRRRLVKAVRRAPGLRIPQRPATSSARPTHRMPPWLAGCSDAGGLVNLVVNGMCSLLTRLCSMLFAQALICSDASSRKRPSVLDALRASAHLFLMLFAQALILPLMLWRAASHRGAMRWRRRGG